MKEFLRALGALLIAFGTVKLLLALLLRRKERMNGHE